MVKFGWATTGTCGQNLVQFCEQARANGIEDLSLGNLGWSTTGTCGQNLVPFDEQAWINGIEDL